VGQRAGARSDFPPPRARASAPWPMAEYIPFPPTASSFRTKRDHGINAGGAAGGEPGGEQGDENQKRGYSDKRGGIER
jgi:hypothetical protein